MLYLFGNYGKCWCITQMLMGFQQDQQVQLLPVTFGMATRKVDFFQTGLVELLQLCGSQVFFESGICCSLD